MLPTNFCDFHCHLGGATPSDTLWEIAYRHGVKLHFENQRELQNAIVRYSFQHEPHAKFLDHDKGPHAIVEALQKSPDAVRKSAFDAAKWSYLSCDSKLCHLELRFDPLKRGPDMMAPLIRAVRQGLFEAGDCFGFSSRVIVCFDRSYPHNLKELRRVVNAAVEAGADGLDICGIESNQERDKDWIARNITGPLMEGWHKGLFLTYHVGETRGNWMNVLNVLEMIEGVARIGHGNDLLMNLHRVSQKELERIRSTVFEVCPSSCLLTNVLSPVEVVECLQNATEYAVPVTINSDNPFVLQTSVKGEFEHAFALLKQYLNDEERVTRIMEHINTSRLRLMTA